MPKATRLSFALLLAQCSIAVPATAQNATPGSDLPLFADDAPLSLRIEGPFRTLSRNRRDREELDGILAYTGAAGRSVRLDLQLRTRGNSRMDLCTYPPLRLDLRRRQVEGTVFSGQNQLKLVTLCKDQTAYRDYLTLEFQLYRLFELLTERAYRVRWVDVEYIDTDRRRPIPEIRSGFLIEAATELAARMDMEIWRTESLDLAALETEHTALVGLFAYLIGNSDWSVVRGAPGDRCCHNGDLFRDAAGRAVVVPYDFDQSGLINATYASPADNLPIRSVTQRLYRGYCIHNDRVAGAVNKLIDSRNDIEALFHNAEVQPRTRQRVLRYVESFYDIIEDPEARAERIYDACRG